MTKPFYVMLNQNEILNSKTDFFVKMLFRISFPCNFPYWSVAKYPK